MVQQKSKLLFFQPNSNSYKAANIRWVCEEYCSSYGSCSLFQE